MATYETSIRDESGAARKDFGLADLFGVRFNGKSETQMHNAYLRLEHDRAKGNALLAGLEDAPRIIHGVNRVDVAPITAFGPAPLTLIPSYPDLPMEKVYPRVPHTDVAQAFMREVGKGRVVYFPWDVDRAFWEILDADHGALLRNAVTWATNEPPVVRVTGPGVLDVTAWRQSHSMTVHLVNLTNPMMMKGPIREPVAVGPHVVRVRLTGERAGRVRLLVAGTILQPRRSGEWIEVTVPSILEHEVVAIEV